MGYFGSAALVALAGIVAADFWLIPGLVLIGIALVLVVTGIVRLRSESDPRTIKRGKWASGGAGGYTYFDNGGGGGHSHSDGGSGCGGGGCGGGS